MQNKLDLILPDWEVPPNIRAFSSLRYGGVSPSPYHGRDIFEGGLNLGLHVGDKVENVRQNRDLLRKILPGEPCWLNQVHGSHVVNAGATSELPEADASFSLRKNEVCLVQTADCLPVLFCDEAGTVVAAAHAGWRGLLEGVLENTLKQMRQAGTGEILAWMGPAIGPTCFEVGDDVRLSFSGKDKNFDRYFKLASEQSGKYLADIYGLARDVLEKNKVKKIAGGGFCTVSEPDRFYSYRRDGVTGRMGTCIWMT